MGKNRGNSHHSKTVDNYDEAWLQHSRKKNQGTGIFTYCYRGIFVWSHCRCSRPWDGIYSRKFAGNCFSAAEKAVIGEKWLMKKKSMLKIKSEKKRSVVERMFCIKNCKSNERKSDKKGTTLDGRCKCTIYGDPLSNLNKNAKCMIKIWKKEGINHRGVASSFGACVLYRQK